MHPHQPPPGQQYYAPGPPKPKDGLLVAVIGIVIAVIGAILTYVKNQDTGFQDWTTSLAAAMASTGPIIVAGCVLAIGGAVVNAIARLRR